MSFEETTSNDGDIPELEEQQSLLQAQDKPEPWSRPRWLKKRGWTRWDTFWFSLFSGLSLVLIAGVAGVWLHDLSESASHTSSIGETETDLSPPSLKPPPAIPTSLPTDSFPVSPDQDYILDPNWDYDAKPQRREYTWTVTDVELNPDGVFRPMTVINDQFPGPLIEVNEDDTIIVHVNNHAENATSIHWHGIYQNGTNWMDGTVGVTNCPIAPGASFTYEFDVSRQSGTYFYHGHHAAQAVDGLVGPLVIHSKDEKKNQQIEYATDRVIMVQDHYYDLSGDLLKHYLSPGMEDEEPVPSSALINGRGVRNCDLLSERKCDNSTILPFIFALEPSKNHRLRVINTGAFAEFQVQIDHHEFAVTEVDGTDVVPVNYHRLNINPAQRYSIVIASNMSDANAFWLRARMVTHCFSEENPEMKEEARAMIRYSSELTMNDLAPPTSKDWSEAIEVECRDLNTTELVPIVSMAAPEPDDTIYLRANFEIGDWRLSRGFFNGSTWIARPTSPTLHRFKQGVDNSNETFVSTIASPYGVNHVSFDTSRELVYQTNGIQTVDLLISNFDDGIHPFHLHGYKFFVLASGHGYPPSMPALYDSIDTSNPLRRDTASIEGYGWILIRVTFDNPGVWALHCHVLWHSEAGLLMQFLARAEEIASWNIPEENLNICKLEDAEKGGRPDDSIWEGSGLEGWNKDEQRSKGR